MVHASLVHLDQPCSSVSSISVVPDLVIEMTESGSELNPEVLSEDSSYQFIDRSDDWERSSSVPSSKAISESPISLMSRLCSPTPSDLSRKWKMKQNPPVGQKRGKGRVVGNPIKITPDERVRAYPNEHFTVNYNKSHFVPLAVKSWPLKRASLSYT